MKNLGGLQIQHQGEFIRGFCIIKQPERLAHTERIGGK